MYDIFPHNTYIIVFFFSIIFHKVLLLDNVLYMWDVKSDIMAYLFTDNY